MTRAVDRYLALLLGVVLAAAAAGAATGLMLVDQDLAQTGEMFDGLGLALGGVALGLVVVPAAAAVVALRRLHRGDRSAHRWVLAAGVLGGLAVVPFGIFHRPLFVLLAVPALLVVATLATLRGRR